MASIKPEQPEAPQRERERGRIRGERMKGMGCGVVAALPCLVLLLAMSQWVDSAPVEDAAAAVASTSDLQALTVTYPVDFEVKLNVEGLTASSYQTFLTDFRIKLGAQFSGKVPILPSYGSAPPHLFDVLLTTSNRQVTVRGRRDNLYLRGYLMQTPKQWMEFNVEGLHMVDPKSKFLDFGDRYGQLEAAMNPPGTPEAQRIKVTDISYTKTALKDAVEKLATSTNNRERARSLIFMAQMLSEAARFVHVASFFGSQLVKGEHLPLWMRTLQNDWGKLSTTVQCKDAYPNYIYKKVTINKVVYNTTDQLRTIFGIMLKESKILDPKTCGIKKLADEGEAAAVLLSANI